jgi:hypothetical protein
MFYKNHLLKLKIKAAAKAAALLKIENFDRVKDQMSGLPCT